MPNLASTESNMGLFNNEDTVAPGGEGIGTMNITLGGNMADMPAGTPVYTPHGPSVTSEGTLALNFNSAGKHSSLVITGTQGSGSPVDIEGSRLFRPIADFYANSFSATIRNDETVVTENIDAAKISDTAVSNIAYNGLTLDFTLSSTSGINGINTITATRAANAYSSLMDSAALYSGVGVELDRIAGGGDPSADLRCIYEFIDFSADRGAIESASRFLTPTLQNSIATVLVQSQFLVNDTLFNDGGYQNEIRVAGFASDRAVANTTAASRFARRDGMYFFFSPYGGGGRQSGKGWDVPGYSFWQGGGVLGLEKRSHGSTLGLHLAASHLRLSGKNSGDELKNTAIALGAHGKFQPADWGGGYLFGLARAGADIARQHREVMVGNEYGLNKGEWTGFSASALAGAGYGFGLGCVSVGPEASFEYALSHQPSFTEKNGLGRLQYDSTSYNSLRSNLGVKATWDITNKALFTASAAWTHELLDKLGTTRAGFDGYGNSGIVYKAKTS